ncbi:MAG TPA: CGNR zinc finger domain-containing protein [Pseudonocardiaceae bacterium]|jgi:predicted RNA-binding Zn ribbon-like protein|nr:CGNR zinc finger domain-containing protein [Pseudonocardiaceae bacterium]
MRMAIDAMSPVGLVELVNQWGTAPRAADGRSDKAYPAVADLAGQLGVPDPAAGTLDAAELARVADRLHPVFAATEPAERARLITDMLGETEVCPTLVMTAGRPRAGWLVARRQHAVLAAAAIALRRYLADHGPDRLGICTGRRCADVYLDTSPAGRRRFCSVTCQNRARVAAFRDRQAAVDRR